MSKAKFPLQPIDTGLISFEKVVETRSSLSLRPYQQDHLAFYLSQNRSLSLEDAGTGKTIPACIWVYSKTTEDKIVWAMPRSLMAKNYEELLLWSNLEPHQIMLVTGTKAQREAQMRNPDAKVFIMGFDSFANTWEFLRSIHPKAVHLCLDELHLGFSTHGEPHYSKPNAYLGPARTHNMYEYLKKGGHYLGMTGTFINGRLTSAYPSINMIEPKYYGSYNNFVSWHAILDEFGRPTMWKNPQRLNDIIAKHSRAFTYEQAYGSEDKEVFVEYCTMGTKQYEAYKKMADRGIVELDQAILEDGNNPGVNLIRCLELMQIPEKYDLPINMDDGKEAHLLNYFEQAKQTGIAMIVFEVRVAGHKKIQALAEKAGLNFQILNGSVSDSERMQIDAEFRSGKIDGVVASPQVAGVGYNWGHCDLIIFNSLDFQDTTFIQNYRRALRGERTSTLRVVVLEYRGSIDRRIQQNIERKSQDRAKVENRAPLYFIRPAGHN